MNNHEEFLKALVPEEVHSRSMMRPADLTLLIENGYIVERLDLRRENGTMLERVFISKCKLIIDNDPFYSVNYGEHLLSVTFDSNLMTMLPYYSMNH